MSPPNEIDALRSYLAIAPKNYEARFRLGTLLHAARDFQGAIAHLQQCKIDPKFRIPATKLIIEALRAQKMFDIAEQFSSELEDGDGSGGAVSPKRPSPPPPLIHRNED